MQTTEPFKQGQVLLSQESDGITHVNVYSQGRTMLGRSLSNFAYTPFEFEGKQFASVEAFWYWQGRDYDYAELRTLSGFKAKQYGAKLAEVPPPGRDALKLVYMAKLSANPGLQRLLSANKLPLTHYYVFGGKVVPATQWLWTATLWQELA